MQVASITPRKRKKCRREVKRTLRLVGWAPPRQGGLRQEDVTKLWLAAKCAACRRCPKLSAELATWRRASGE